MKARTIVAAATLLVALTVQSQMSVAQGDVDLTSLAQGIEERMKADLGDGKVQIWVQGASSWTMGPEQQVTKPDLLQDQHMRTALLLGPAIRWTVKSLKPAIQVTVGVSVVEVVEKLKRWLFGDDEPENRQLPPITIIGNDGVINITSYGRGIISAPEKASND